MAKTVTVGCKIPNGLRMEMGAPGEANHKVVVLKGANSASVFGGHGITENVDAEFFSAWMDAHKDQAYVKNGHVFAHEKTANTQAEATEKVDNATGLEPLNPSKMPAGLKAGVDD